LGSLGDVVKRRETKWNAGGRLKVWEHKKASKVAAKEPDTLSSEEAKYSF
jgi:hypothetical protein